MEGRVIFALMLMLSGLGMTPTYAADDADAIRCQALEGSRFAGLPGAPTYIVKASYRPASPDKGATCAVEGYVNPTVNFGLLLPVGHWNGRYLVRGCGGSCGGVVLELACAAHARDGYACLHTDMGHRSTLADNNWVTGNLQGLVDFGYRATHVTAVAGRAILQAFFNADARHSYFFACSTGGRQGLVEAQRFPEDFDGIVTIAPASMAPFGKKKAASISDVDRFNLDADGNPILPNRKTLLIHRAAINKCDKDDGLADGLIGNPLQCRFRPAELLCKTGDARDCLTPAQVTVVEKLYDWRGAMPGSEFNWIGNFLRNAPLPGEASQPLFDLAVGRGDPVVVETLNAPNNPDLRPFRDNKGKLILVHGWDDPSVMPRPTIDYYETMTKTMGGTEATRDFARLFMIPGMDHCAGGNGASAIDYMGAVVDWVENAKAPDKLRGVHPTPGAPLDFFGVDLPRLDPKYVAFERDHYAWPKGSVAVKGKTMVAEARKTFHPLSEALKASIERAEKTSIAANFPRRNTLNAILKAMWETLYISNDSAQAQLDAVSSLTQGQFSPVVTEAVARMRAELALN